MDSPIGPQVVRGVWLTGGLTALSEPGVGAFSIHAGSGGSSLATFSSPTFDDLFSTLIYQGFKIIGTTFLVNKDEMQGLMSPEFRAMGLDYTWATSDTRHLWRQIASGSARRNEMRLFDISSRIAIGLQMSEMRLNDLAVAYSRQLHAYVQRGKAVQFRRFGDTFTRHIYKEIHALFWEMAVLRDTLAQFAAVYLLRIHDITAMGSLRKVLKTLTRDELTDHLYQITDLKKSGWLAIFGAYRDCFTHSAPLQQLEGREMGFQDMLQMNDGNTFPQLYYPLPSNVSELTSKRAKGPLFNSFEEMVDNSSRKKTRSTEPDALEYLHATLFRITDLARKLLPHSPIAPEPIVISAEDTIDGFHVTMTMEEF